MIDTESLQQAFGRLERHIPAEADVLTGMREGIVRRRRRRQVTSMVGVASVASLVVLGAFVASGRNDDQREPGGAPPNAVSPAPPALPFTVGWVPDGYQLRGWHAAPSFGGVTYGRNGPLERIEVLIAGRKPAGPVDGEVDEDTTVAGRPGVLRSRSAPDQQDNQLFWSLDDGRWAMVSGSAPTVSLDMLRSVAEGLSLRPTPMEASFGLTALPDGYQVQHWSERSLTLCRPAVVWRLEPVLEAPGDCVHLSVLDGTAPPSIVVFPHSRPAMSPSDEPVPLDQEQVVNGVSTRATADGTAAVAQVDAGHWVQVRTQQAGVDVLRRLASTTYVR